MYEEDEDNDGRYPDESPIEVRFSRSKAAPVERGWAVCDDNHSANDDGTS